MDNTGTSRAKNAVDIFMVQVVPVILGKCQPVGPFTADLLECFG